MSECSKVQAEYRKLKKLELRLSKVALALATWEVEIQRIVVQRPAQANKKFIRLHLNQC
jgi:hypothetical protein